MTSTDGLLNERFLCTVMPSPHSFKRGQAKRIQSGTVTTDALSALLDYKLCGIETPLALFLVQNGCSIDDPDRLYAVARDFSPDADDAVDEVNLFSELCNEYPEPVFCELSYYVVFSGCCQCDVPNQQHRTLQDCQLSLPLLCKLNSESCTGLKSIAVNELAKFCTINIHNEEFDGMISATDCVVQDHVIYSHLSDMTISSHALPKAFENRSSALVCRGTGTAWYRGKTYSFPRTFHRKLTSCTIARTDLCVCRSGCDVCRTSLWGGHLMAYSYGLCSYAALSKSRHNSFEARCGDERIWIPNFFRNCYHILIR